MKKFIIVLCILMLASCAVAEPVDAPDKPNPWETSLLKSFDPYTFELTPLTWYGPPEDTYGAYKISEGYYPLSDVEGSSDKIIQNVPHEYSEFADGVLLSFVYTIKNDTDELYRFEVKLPFDNIDDYLNGCDEVYAFICSIDNQRVKEQSEYVDRLYADMKKVSEAGDFAQGSISSRTYSFKNENLSEFMNVVSGCNTGSEYYILLQFGIRQE